MRPDQILVKIRIILPDSTRPKPLKQNNHRFTHTCITHSHITHIQWFKAKAQILVRDNKINSSHRISREKACYHALVIPTFTDLLPFIGRPNIKRNQTSKLGIFLYQIYSFSTCICKCCILLVKHIYTYVRRQQF